MRKVLLLNQSYQPLSVISWKKAVCLVYLNKADVVKEYNFTINSPSLSLSAPCVIRLRLFFSRPKCDVRLTRSNVFARDGWKCVYCNKKFPEYELTTDHVIPKSHGGKNTWENLVCCCKKCNGIKGNKMLKDVGFTLIKTPKKPDWMTFFSKAMLKGKVPNEWLVYANLS